LVRTALSRSWSGRATTSAKSLIRAKTEDPEGCLEIPVGLFRYTSKRQRSIRVRALKHRVSHDPQDIQSQVGQGRLDRRQARSLQPVPILVPPSILQKVQTVLYLSVPPNPFQQLLRTHLPWIKTGDVIPCLPLYLTTFHLFITHPNHHPAAHNPQPFPHIHCIGLIHPHPTCLPRAPFFHLPGGWLTTLARSKTGLQGLQQLWLIALHLKQIIQPLFLQHLRQWPPGKNASPVRSITNG